MAPAEAVPENSGVLSFVNPPTSLSTETTKVGLKSLPSELTNSTPSTSTVSVESSPSTPTVSVESSPSTPSSDIEVSTLSALIPASSVDGSPTFTIFSDNDTTISRLVLLPARSVATTLKPMLSGRGIKTSARRRTSPLFASIDKPVRGLSSKGLNA